MPLNDLVEEMLSPVGNAMTNESLSQLPQIFNSFHGFGVRNQGVQKIKAIIKVLAYLSKLHFSVKNLDYKEFSCGDYT